jgi:hypothetical protein
VDTFSVQGLGQSKDGTVRVDTDNDTFGALFLNLLGNTGDGTTSSSRSDKHVDLSTTLRQDFLSGALK